MRWKRREEAAPPKKKSLALKSSSTLDDEEEDEELSLLVQNVKRMYRKNKLNFRRKFEGKEERRIICYNCRKPGHIMADCPEFKKKVSSSKPKKPMEKKAYKATWDSESESEEEVDQANMCFMANTPKVCLLYTSPSPRDRQKSRMPSSA